MILTEVQAFLNADRVNLYRFEVDGTGQVIDEVVKNEKIPSLLNLYFPAQDIPEVAKERFLRSRVRVQVDTTNARYSLQFPGQDAPIHYLKADSCHLRYLQQLGVQAALTYPLIIRGQLWGLLAIHNISSRRWSETQLSSLELMVERLTLAIASEELSQRYETLAQQEQTLSQISNLLATSPPNWEMALESAMSSFFGCGARLYLSSHSNTGEAQVYTTGVQPHRRSLEETRSWREHFSHAASPLGVESFPSYLLNFDTAEALEKPIVEAFAETEIKSIFAIALTSGQEIVGYLSIFRSAYERTILWAGRPPKTDEKPTSPRESFAPYQEIRKNYLLPWTVEDRKFGKAIAEKFYSAVRQQQLEALKSHPYYHPLTNLPNRHLFSKELTVALLEANATEEVMGIIFLDLDRFTQVNKTLGHQAGDLLLQLTAQRLKNQLSGANSLLAYWSGDKFVCLLRHLHGKSGIELEKMCQTLGEVFVDPFDIDSQAVYVSASLGVALAPYDGTTPEILLLNAETAMYSAKYQGGNTYSFYSPSLGDRLNPLSLEADLRASLQKNEFRLDYQPQIDLHTGRVVAVEALMRWQHPARGLVSPGEFIPLAEESSLICDLGEWTLREACLQHAQWREMSLGSIRIAVNISARQFQQPSFVSTVAKILAETQTPGSALEIEITEGTAARDVEFTTAVMEQLREMGIQVALDDFGTGYSCLNSIKHFPIHTLKIDKSFVQEMMGDSTNAAIVKAIVALGHGLNLQVLAEGVEKIEELDFLRSIRCDQVQGYFFSPPLIAKTATEFLKNSLLSELERESSVFSISCNLHSLLPVGVAVEAQVGKGVILNEGSQGNEVNLNLESSFSAQEIPSHLHQIFAQTRREQLVNEIAQQIRSSLDLETIFHTTVTQTRQFLETDRVILYQFSSHWDGTVVMESVGDEWISLVGKEIPDPCFRTKSAPLYRRGRVSAIADIQKGSLSKCYRTMLEEFEVQANLVVPIVNGETLWGLLIAHHCRSPREWQPTEIELLQQLATQSAIAIHQAELYQQLEQANQELKRLATQDGLTQVANRRYFDEYLAQEWQRAQREKDPISLILCDVDYFKRYNDTYGHQEGDQCLQQVATVMSQLIKRSTDLVARYGGEEFAIILPNTPPEGAMQLAEHLRTQIHKLQIPHISSSVSYYITLSLGVATIIPSQEMSVSSLIQAADVALYSAKQRGRNLVQQSDWGVTDGERA